MGLTAYSFIYQYKDHLGNVRLSYKQKPNGVLEVIKQNSYYAFGMRHDKQEVVSSSNIAEKRMYNGMELQDELNLNWYDYQARNYDPAIGRWFNIDPLAEKSRRFSPYVYALNNPVYFIDPDGMEATPSEVDMVDLNANLVINVKPEDDVVIDPPKGSKTIDPPKPGEGTRSGSLEKVLPNGAPSGDLAEATDLDVVTIEGKTTPKTGEAYGFGGNAALGGGIGYEVGLVRDGENNWGAYFTFKGNVGLGGGLGVSTTSIIPTHDGSFLLSDFEGTSLEINAGFNSPIGGFGLSGGGTSPDAGQSIPDRFSTIGNDKRGYITGSFSPELNGPAPKLSGQLMVTKSKTWVWDF